MDVATLSAGLTIPIISGAVGIVLVLSIVVFIYKFSIQEKSFEEVIEEQKRRKLEEEQQQKLKKTKKEKIFKRSWLNKKKDKAERDPTPDSVSIEKKDIPSIEIIEPKESKPVKQKNKKSSPSANPNATAVEKTEVAVGTDSPIQNKKKESPTTDKRKDGIMSDKKKEIPVADKKKEVLIVEKKEAPIVEKKKEVSSEEKETEKSKFVNKQTEVLKSKENVSMQSTAPNPNKRKRKEQTEKATIVETLTASKLLSLIKEAALDTDEIQNLIDILLNKQKDSANWTKKNDQLANTKRDLQEKEQQLDLELRQNQAVVLKLKDVREEYNQLKVKYSSLEKSSQEKISKQQQEIQHFTTRVKQIQEQLVAEKEKTAQLDKHIEEKVAAAQKIFEEEKMKLQQRLSKLEAESRSGTSKVDFDAMKKAKDDLQKVHNLLVDQHTQLVGSHKKEIKNITTKLTTAEKQLEEINAKNATLTKDIKELKDAKAALESSKKTLEEKLTAEQNRYLELEQQQKQVVKKLQSEIEQLTEQLVSTKERVAGDGQEILHQNGELNGKAEDDATLKSLEEKEKLLKEKEALLAQVNEDYNKLKTRVSILDQEIEEQKKKNNELREKNWKAMDALKTAEQSAEQKVKEIQNSSEQRLSELRKEYEEKLHLSDSNQSNIPAELTERLKKVELDYNSEVQKCKQLTTEVDRLSAFQKSAESRISETEKVVQDLTSQIKSSQDRTKECLLRIHPDIKIDNSLPYETWLSEFQKQATHVISSSSNKQSEEASKLKLLLDEKDKELLEKESKIKEVMMITLQELQESAEVKERKWQENLQQKEAELQKVISERDALSAEKESIQSAFQQMDQLEELQEKLKLLQSTLQHSENEKSHAEQKYDEVHKNCINLRDQLENKEKQILELQKEKNSVEHLTKEIETLKSNLEKEKKINKEFSSQMIRLNSLVKIGQDSLSAEQELVKQLKSQLQASQVNSVTAANGTPPASMQSSNSESKPKTKSSEKSKKKTDASVKK